MDSLLEVRNLHTAFHSEGKCIQVLNGIDFTLEQGKILGIVGESGSGKSVTAYTILGLHDMRYTDVSGNIFLRGTDILQLSSKEYRSIRGKKISMIFQDPMTSLNPLYTIGNQIVEAILSSGVRKTKQEARERTVELLTLVGMSDAKRRMKQHPHELSGGMRQRAMIAMALSSEPDILIADEPTTALDVTVQAQILELIRDLTKKLHMATILITHDLGIVVEMCDDVVVLYAGRICERGNVRQIFYHPAHEYTKGLLRSIPDIKGTKAMEPIAGNPVNLLKLPKGCAFCARCDHAMKVCLEQQPVEKEIEPQHIAACFMNDRQEVDGDE